MKRGSQQRSKGLRRAELALWALGVCLLGVAFAATAARWSYQEQQERAVFGDAGPDFSAAREMPSRRELPVQAVETVEEKPAPKKSEPRKREAVADPHAFGRIEIPRLGMRAIIRKGADDGTLARAVGLVPGAAQPGEAGNVVLAAHRDTFFRPLRKIRVEDQIRLVVPPEEYVYQVESMRVVSPDETSVLQSKGVDELTLITCYPFRFVGPAPQRFVVTAKRVQ